MKTHQNIRALTLNKMRCRSLRGSYGVFPTKLVRKKISVEVVETGGSVIEGEISVCLCLCEKKEKRRERRAWLAKGRERYFERKGVVGN